MKNTLTLPMSRVNALAIETGKTPELAIADLLSVFHSRKMWAHFAKSKSSSGVAIFVYGPNVPTLRRRKASPSPFTREPDCLMDISADKKEIRIVTKHGEQINNANSAEKNKQ